MPNPEPHRGGQGRLMACGHADGQLMAASRRVTISGRAGFSHADGVGAGCGPAASQFYTAIWVPLPGPQSIRKTWPLLRRGACTAGGDPCSLQGRSLLLTHRAARTRPPPTGAPLNFCPQLSPLGASSFWSPAP